MGKNTGQEEGQNHIADARRLYEAAQWLFRGIEALSKGNVNTLSPACTYLAGQTIESALKAFLLSKGCWTVDKLKTEFGHDLKALWNKSAAQGLNLEKKPPKWFCMVHKLHTSFALRYPSFDMTGTPAFEPMVTDLREILYQVKSAMQTHNN